MHAPNPTPAPAAARIGIAGSLSGLRVAHAEHFRQAHARLLQAGVPTLLGDDAATPERAAALAGEFARAGVQLVIGHFNSDCARAAIPVYRAQGIALLLPAATDTRLPLGAGVYRLCADDAAQAQRMAQWLRTRAADAAPAEVRADGSPYAQRLLHALRGELGGHMPAVRSTTATQHPPSRVCLVIALARQAIHFVHDTQALAGSRNVLFSDEAAVAELHAAVAASSANCWVVTPAPSYETLVDHACALAARWHAQGAGDDFCRWAATHAGLPTSGQPLHAGWALRHCARTPAAPRPDITPDLTPQLP